MKVEFSRQAQKDIQSIPKQVALKLGLWVVSVEEIGLELTRKHGGKGLHDEPLRGNRLGQRSIRLNRSYRAIYSIRKNVIEFVQIEEVNKHDY